MFLNIEKIGMDSYYRFHNEHHLEKTFPQWNQDMRSVVVQFIDLVIVEEHVEPNEDEEEVVVVNEAPSIGM